MSCPYSLHHKNLHLHYNQTEVDYLKSNGEFDNSRSKKFGEKYTVIVSKKRHQYSESECGMYCIYFIIQMLLDKSFSSFQKKKIPDKKMLALRKKYFNSPKHT